MALTKRAFDDLAEGEAVDAAFLDEADPAILDNMCAVLSCRRADIANIVPMKSGLTNLTFRFDALGDRYVYRHPGQGTEAIIDRACETASQRVAADLGIDSTFVYEDPETGWKLSRYVEGARPLDYHDEEDVARAMRISRALHGCGADTGFAFDLHADTVKTAVLLDDASTEAYPDFAVLFERADRLDALVKADGVAPVLCHNDFYPPNFLVSGDRIDLIDWEYSGMSDYASDLAVFICCSDYTYEEALHVLEVYFGRPLADDELFHCVASVAVVAFHWFVWALYQEMVGSPVGHYLDLYHEYAVLYGDRACGMIGARGSSAV